MGALSAKVVIWIRHEYGLHFDPFSISMPGVSMTIFLGKIWYMNGFFKLFHICAILLSVSCNISP